MCPLIQPASGEERTCLFIYTVWYTHPTKPTPAIARFCCHKLRIKKCTSSCRMSNNSEQCRCKDCDGARTFYDAWRWQARLALACASIVCERFRADEKCFQMILMKSFSTAPNCQLDVRSSDTPTASACQYEHSHLLQVTPDADKWAADFQLPPDPMWTESNWPSGHPSLRLYQVPFCS